MTDTYKFVAKISSDVVDMKADILVRIITEYYNNEDECFSTETNRIVISKQLVKEAMDYFMKHEPDRFRLLQDEAHIRIARKNGGE